MLPELPPSASFTGFGATFLKFPVVVLSVQKVNGHVLYVCDGIALSAALQDPAVMGWRITRPRR